MIRIYRVEGDHLKQLEELTDLDCINDHFWIDLMSPTAEEDRTVEQFLRLHIPTREDMQEIEASAQFYDEAGAEYMTMQAVAQVHIDDPIKTPVSFILRGNALVTVRYEEFLSISQYVTIAKKKGGMPSGGTEGILLGILESFINRIADALEALGGEIDGISRDIFRTKTVSINRKTLALQVAIRKIGGKGDLLGMLRESLASITRLILHHQGERGEVLSKPLRQRINSLSRDAASLSDHAGFLSGKMNFLLDATLGMINLEQNQIIKIFSIVAVVFLPPTLVASIYGMNFHHMPELDWWFGYPLALLGMLVSALVPLWYFQRKGWL
jgi:magnesium transporter